MFFVEQQGLCQEQNENSPHAIVAETFCGVVMMESLSFAWITKFPLERFTGIIFAHSDINDPGNFVDFLENNKNKTKNLNGIRSAISLLHNRINKYGHIALVLSFGQTKMVLRLKYLNEESHDLYLY